MATDKRRITRSMSRHTRDETPKQIEASTSILTRRTASPRPATPGSQNSGSKKSFRTRPDDRGSHLFDTDPHKRWREPSEEGEPTSYPFVTNDLEDPWFSDEDQQEEEHEVPAEVTEETTVKGKGPVRPLGRLQTSHHSEDDQEADDETDEGQPSKKQPGFTRDAYGTYVHPANRPTVTPMMKSAYYTPLGSTLKIPQPAQRRSNTKHGETSHGVKDNHQFGSKDIRNWF